MTQIKVQKTKEYFVYFKFYELKSWVKRSANNRRRFVLSGYLQRILGISGKALTQHLVRFLDDDKGFRIDPNHQGL